MRLSVIQVVAALGAAVCVVIAFIAAGVGLISSAFMLLAVAALAFIAWTAIRRALGHGREQTPVARSSGSVQPKP
jgi:hypothetical protein